MDDTAKKLLSTAIKIVNHKIYQEGYTFDLADIYTPDLKRGCFWGLLPEEEDIALSEALPCRDLHDLRNMTYVTGRFGFVGLSRFFSGIQTKEDVSNITWEEWKAVAIGYFGLKEVQND